MRKRNASRKFGRERSQRRALMRGLCENLFLHGSVKTTLARAKEMRSVAERAVSLGKRQDLASRRLLSAQFSSQVAKKVYSDIAPRYTERRGGYTRILKLGVRSGDAAPLAKIELV